MGNTVQNGKGSRPRPTNKKIWDENFDDISWNHKKKSDKKNKPKRGRKDQD